MIVQQTSCFVRLIVRQPSTLLKYLSSNHFRSQHTCPAFNLNGSESLATMAWQRELGSKSLASRVWLMTLGNESFEARTWQRQLGSEIIETRAWQRQLSSESLAARACRRDNCNESFGSEYLSSTHFSSQNQNTCPATNLNASILVQQSS